MMCKNKQTPKEFKRNKYEHIEESAKKTKLTGGITRKRIDMMCLSLLFDLNKTIQVTAYLLKQNENKMNHLRLLNLLHLINREALKEDADLIIYDTAYAVPRGAILRTVYQLIKGRDTQSRQWQRYIETGQYHVFLGNDPGNDELSKFEENIIKSVFDQHREQGDIELIEFMHTLPERKRYEPGLMSVKGKSSYHIELKEIVDAIVEQTGNGTENTDDGYSGYSCCGTGFRRGISNP